MQLPTLTLLLLTFTPSIIATPTGDLTARQAVTTENGLSAACKAVTVIFARGTNEAGNVGEIAGPPWFTRLRAGLGTAATTVQGVTYVANVAGYQVSFSPVLLYFVTSLESKSDWSVLWGAAFSVERFLKGFGLGNIVES